MKKEIREIIENRLAFYGVDIPDVKELSNEILEIINKAYRDRVDRNKEDMIQFQGKGVDHIWDEGNDCVLYSIEIPLKEVIIKALEEIKNL